MNEVIRAVAQRDATGLVTWAFDIDPTDHVAFPISAICDATDDYLLARHGYKVTITVEREHGEAGETLPLLTGTGQV